MILPAGGNWLLLPLLVLGCKWRTRRLSHGKVKSLWHLRALLLSHDSAPYVLIPESKASLQFKHISQAFILTLAADLSIRNSATGDGTGSPTTSTTAWHKKLWSEWKDATGSWVPHASTKALRCTQGAPTSAFPQATSLWSSIRHYAKVFFRNLNSTETRVLQWFTGPIHLKVTLGIVDLQGME